MSRTLTSLTLALLMSLPVFAKDKYKSALPPDVLRAETVLVIINPDAGEPLTNLGANGRAREAVEKALMKWGRFRVVQDPITADLIFAVRTGNGRFATTTARGGAIDNRPVIVQPSDGGDIRIGGHTANDPSRDTGPHLSSEVGSPDDLLDVYRGREEQPAVDSAPIWRYTSKDALRAPVVPAVEEFKKALTEAEKAAAQKAGKPKP